MDNGRYRQSQYLGIDRGSRLTSLPEQSGGEEDPTHSDRTNINEGWLPLLRHPETCCSVLPQLKHSPQRAKDGFLGRTGWSRCSLNHAAAEQLHTFSGLDSIKG